MEVTVEVVTVWDDLVMEVVVWYGVVLVLGVVVLAGVVLVLCGFFCEAVCLLLGDVGGFSWL